MLLLVLLFFLSFFLVEETTTLTPNETVLLAALGFAWSWILSGIKRLVRDLNGRLAHLVMVGVSILMAVAVLLYNGQLHSLTDVVKSSSVVVALAVTAYQWIVKHTGIEDPEAKSASKAYKRARRGARRGNKNSHS
jgi:hypothetical protein